MNFHRQPSSRTVSRLYSRALRIIGGVTTHPWDRHPLAGGLLVLPAGYTIIDVLLAYPWFFVPVLVVVCAVIVDRRQRQRRAIAARADHAYRKQIAEAVFAPRKLPQVRRRRAAYHWSATEPLSD
jgi:hypothetical protein